MKLEEVIFENLPSILQRLVEPFEGRERDIVLLSSITALSSAIPRAFMLYKGDKVYANLFLFIIAPPASGKGVMKYSRRLLVPIHKKVIRDSNEVEIKIIPANISTAELYDCLDKIHQSGLMIETEADTLSSMFKNEWGNFSDVLRKVAHHEPLSKKRKSDNRLLEIEEPKMSLVLSGTPSQIRSLVQSKEDGLFSRFMYYYFDETQPWADVFEATENYNSKFDRVGEIEISQMYDNLVANESETQFILPDNLKLEFQDRIKRIVKIVEEHHPKSFDSNVKRHGVYFLRICLVLTALRNYDRLNNIEVLECNEQDFETAYSIISNLLNHALGVLVLMGEKGLPALDEKILKKLKKEFATNEAISIGNELGYSPRTIASKIKGWEEMKIIKNIRRGIYEKIKM